MKDMTYGFTEGNRFTVYKPLFFMEFMVYVDVKIAIPRGIKCYFSANMTTILAN